MEMCRRPLAVGRRLSHGKIIYHIYLSTFWCKKKQQTAYSSPTRNHIFPCIKIKLHQRRNTLPGLFMVKENHKKTEALVWTSVSRSTYIITAKSMSMLATFIHYCETKEIEVYSQWRWEQRRPGWRAEAVDRLPVWVGCRAETDCGHYNCTQNAPAGKYPSVPRSKDWQQRRPG